MIASLIFLCVPVEATSPTALLCESGQRVLLADVRAAAPDETTRNRQKQALAAIALNKTLRCVAVEQRATLTVGRCTYQGRDIATQQVLAGNAQFRPNVMLASRALPGQQAQ